MNSLILFLRQFYARIWMPIEFGALSERCIVSYFIGLQEKSLRKAVCIRDCSALSRKARGNNENNVTS